MAASHRLSRRQWLGRAAGSFGALLLPSLGRGVQAVAALLDLGRLVRHHVQRCGQRRRRLPTISWRAAVRPTGRCDRTLIPAPCSRRPRLAAR